MSRVEGGLFSLKAHGSIRKTITYQQVRDQTRVKTYRGKIIPAGPEQTVIRNYIKTAVSVWKGMNETGREEWEQTVDEKGNTGYHAFISYYILKLIELFAYEGGDEMYSPGCGQGGCGEGKCGA